MELFGQHLTKEQIRQRIGHISQLAGAKRYILKEGRADGVEAVDVKTGSGFYFTVLPGRGMDIAWTEYKGIPIAHIAKSGIVNSQLYDPRGQEWLRSFYAGMLTENIVLTREIISKLGESKFIIKDRVENEGYTDTPFMILYHINIGYPIASESGCMVAPINKTTPWSDKFPYSEIGADSYNQFESPDAKAGTQVFFHEIAEDEDGNTCVGMINDRIQLGTYVSYNKRELPYLSQAKVVKQQDYYNVVEPGNCYPEGRVSARENGRLTMLKPGEVKEITVEIGILDGFKQIEDFKKLVDSMKWKA